MTINTRFIKFREENLRVDGDAQVTQNLGGIPGSDFIPIRDFLNGEIGFIICNKDSKTEQVCLTKISPQARFSKVTTEAELDRILYDSLTYDYPVKLWEMPHERVTGFIVYKQSGPVYHHIEVSKLGG